MNITKLKVNNTLVDCYLGIRIGTVKKSSTTLAPENVNISNNIMFKSSNSTFQEVQYTKGI